MTHSASQWMMGWSVVAVAVAAAAQFILVSGEEMGSRLHLAPKPTVQLDQLTPVETTLLGAAAGMLARLIDYPLLSWKNASQQVLMSLSLSQPVAHVGMACECNCNVQQQGDEGLHRWSCDPALTTDADAKRGNTPTHVTSCHVTHPLAFYVPPSRTKQPHTHAHPPTHQLL